MAARLVGALLLGAARLAGAARAGAGSWAAGGLEGARQRGIGASVEESAAAEVVDVPPDVARLPPELVRRTLKFLQLRPPVAWCSGGKAVTLALSGGVERLTLPHLTQSRVRAMRFFPDGGRLLAVGPDVAGATVAVPSGRLLQPFRHDVPDHALHDVQVFPDGKRWVVLASGQVLIRCTASGELLQRFRVHAHFAIRVFPSGDSFVTGVSHFQVDRAVLWGIAEESPRGFYMPTNGPVRFLEISPCGEKVVISSAYDAIYVFSKDSRMEASVRIHLAWMWGVAISRHGTHLVASANAKIYIWRGPSYDLRAELDVDHILTPFSLLPSARIVVYTPSAGTVWDAETGAFVATTPVGFKGVRRIASAPDSDVVAACGSRVGGLFTRVEWVVVFDASTGNVLYEGEEGLSFWTTPLPCTIAIGPQHTADELTG